MGVSGIQFSPLLVRGRAVENKADLELTNSEILNIYGIIVKKCNEIGMRVAIDTGSTKIDLYLAKRYGYTAIGDCMCSAMFATAYVNMEGMLYPCRSYRASGVDPKRTDIKWNEVYDIFEPFVRDVLCARDTGRSICPLHRHKINALEELAVKKTEDIECTLKYKTGCFVTTEEFDGRFFVFFLKNNEYVEYTYEGYRIYKEVLSGKNVSEISESTGFPRVIVSQFLDSELRKVRNIK